MDMGSELKSVGELPPNVPPRNEYEKWREWAIRAENDPERAPLGESPIFAWSCGASRCVRFETACRCWNRGARLWRAREYRDAYAAFGDCAFELLAWKTKPRGASPGLEDCGRARLRCAIRLQRAALARFGPRDAEAVATRALWLWAAEETLRALGRGGEEERDAVGKRLFLAARAIAAEAAGDARTAAVLARLAALERGRVLADELAGIRRRCGKGEIASARAISALCGEAAGEMDWEFCFGGSEI